MNPWVAILAKLLDATFTILDMNGVMSASTIQEEL
jgi:hypothetical protein